MISAEKWFRSPVIALLNRRAISIYPERAERQENNRKQRHEWREKHVILVSLEFWLNSLK